MLDVTLFWGHTMIELWIANLKSSEVEFVVPGEVGQWSFYRRDDYTSLLKAMNDGQCAPTYYANNAAIGPQTSDADFMLATGELIDACLILSFFTGACVTPNGTTPQSDVMFGSMGDSFIRPRAISGFDALKIPSTFNEFFATGMASIRSAMAPRQLRLFLSHWISGLTCFSLEDLFLAVGVQMDIVKQCEIAASGKDMQYFHGMQSASTRFGISALGKDYRDMRNDIVHAGKLSDKNFLNRNKDDCAAVIADTLNWIDQYVCAVIGAGASPARWSGPALAAGLPSLTVQ